MDKIVLLIAITVATMAVPILSYNPDMVKASSCSSSSSAAGIRQHISPDVMRRPPPSTSGGCATASGAVGGQSVRAGSATVFGNPSACMSISTSRGLGIDSGTSVSCSSNNSPVPATK